MAYHQFGTKPLPEPMKTCYWFDPWEQTLIKFESKFNHLHSENNRDLHQVVLHLLSEFGASSLMGDELSRRQAWGWQTHTQTHRQTDTCTHTHTGKDNTRRPKLTSCKNAIWTRLFLSDISELRKKYTYVFFIASRFNGFVWGVGWVQGPEHQSENTVDCYRHGCH